MAEFVVDFRYLSEVVIDGIGKVSLAVSDVPEGDIGSALVMISRDGAGESKSWELLYVEALVNFANTVKALEGKTAEFFSTPLRGEQKVVKVLHGNVLNLVPDGEIPKSDLHKILEFCRETRAAYRNNIIERLRKKYGTRMKAVTKLQMTEIRGPEAVKELLASL